MPLCEFIFKTIIALVQLFFSLLSKFPWANIIKVMAGVNGTLCPICQQKTKKLFRHYGGMSCQSCKAFFVRATIKNREFFCKDKNGCKFKIGKFYCKKCRYDRCLRSGMDRQAVLKSEMKRCQQFEKEQCSVLSFLEDDKVVIERIENIDEIEQFFDNIAQDFRRDF